MKAVVCHAPGQLEVIDRASPGPLQAGEIRLAVSHIGICGTDYHIFEGKHPFLQYPRVMGHEISAHVREAAIGSAFREGDLVIVNPYLACGKMYCLPPRKTQLLHGHPSAGRRTDGAFCEEIVAPEANVYPANGLRPEQAATVEFLAIGAHAVRRAGLGATGLDAVKALVIGAGPIGLGTALFARIAGYDVTLLDVSTERLDVAAERFGFKSAIAVNADALQSAMAITAGEGFEAVFDATGNAGSMNAALPFVAHGGVLVFVSVVKDDIVFADPEFHKREMMMIGSRNGLKADFEHVVAAIASGAIDTDKLITHRTDFTSVIDDLPRWAHEKTGLIKAVIQAQA